MDDQRPRVLVAGFTVVPASSADASALLAAARALSTRCEVDIVSIKTDALPHMEQLGRARVLRVPLGGGGRAERASTFRRALRRQLEGEPYDVVHVRGALECAVAVERRRAGVPFKLVYDMGAFPSEDDGPGAEDAWATAHVRSCDGSDVVLAPSIAARRGLQLPDERIEVVPPGVDIDQFDWEPPPAGRATRVLYLGPYASDRDIPTVVSAARLLSRDVDISWLLAGEFDAGRRARIRDMVDSFGLQDTVDVRGEPDVEALPLIISSADVCVVPAAPVARYLDHGDVPQPLLEHLACRRPVVVAGVPAVGQFVREELEGLHYVPADEESLATQLRILASDREYRRALAEAGYRRVRDDFNDAARRRLILATYLRLLDLEDEPAWGWFVADPSNVVTLGTGTGSGDAGEPEPTLLGDNAALTSSDGSELIGTGEEVAPPTTDPQQSTPGRDTAQVTLPDGGGSGLLSIDTGPHSVAELLDLDDTGPQRPPPPPPGGRTAGKSPDGSTLAGAPLPVVPRPPPPSRPSASSRTRSPVRPRTTSVAKGGATGPRQPGATRPQPPPPPAQRPLPLDGPTPPDTRRMVSPDTDPIADTGPVSVPDASDDGQTTIPPQPDTGRSRDPDGEPGA